MRYGPVDVIQPCYSLLWRYHDKDLLPFCIENGIGVIPYSPLAQGLLTGKYGNPMSLLTDAGVPHCSSRKTTRAALK